MTTVDFTRERKIAGILPLFGHFLGATSGSGQRVTLARVEMDEFALLAVENQPETVRRFVGGARGANTFEAFLASSFDHEQARFRECILRQQDATGNGFLDGDSDLGRACGR